MTVDNKLSVTILRRIVFSLRTIYRVRICGNCDQKTKISRKQGRDGGRYWEAVLLNVFFITPYSQFQSETPSTPVLSRSIVFWERFKAWSSTMANVLLWCLSLCRRLCARYRGRWFFVVWTVVTHCSNCRGVVSRREGEHRFVNGSSCRQRVQPRKVCAAAASSIKKIATKLEHWRQDVVSLYRYPLHAMVWMIDAALFLYSLFYFPQWKRKKLLPRSSRIVVT